MENQSALLFSAELRSDLSTLDLHGLYPAEALEKMELFLYEGYQARESAVRVIFGGGTGKLKEEVMRVLAAHPLVGPTKDEGGSVIILINY